MQTKRCTSKIWLNNPYCKKSQWKEMKRTQLQPLCEEDKRGIMPSLPIQEFLKIPSQHIKGGNAVEQNHQPNFKIRGCIWEISCWMREQHYLQYDFFTLKNGSMMSSKCARVIWECNDLRTNTCTTLRKLFWLTDLQRNWMGGNSMNNLFAAGTGTLPQVPVPSAGKKYYLHYFVIYYYYYYYYFYYC